MKTLWTPWRMEHVLGLAPKTKGCLFEVAAGKAYDPPSLLLYRDETSQVLLNRFPYSNGHLLVAPNRHVATLSELTGAESTSLMHLLGQCTKILDRHLHAAGYNVGANIGAAAGAGIAEHLHFHVVPRWPEDHNFMTILAEVRTIPEHLEQTYNRLLPDFQELLPETLFNKRPHSTKP